LITFVIPAHDEADTVGASISMATAAAQRGDRVLVVDSASTDGTADAARAAGAEVYAGPLGKGGAMRVGVDASDTEWIVFLDADARSAERNIAADLAGRARRNEADQIVGDFHDGLDAVLTLTDGFYGTLVPALFPEVAGAFGSKALTGFRAVRRSYLLDLFPRDYGVESHLNIEITMTGGNTEVHHVGAFTGKSKTNNARCFEVTGAIFDCAVRHGRLLPRQRPAWEAWAADLYKVTGRWTPDMPQDEYREQLFAAASRPLPATGVPDLVS